MCVCVCVVLCGLVSKKLVSLGAFERTNEAPPKDWDPYAAAAAADPRPTRAPSLTARASRETQSALGSDESRLVAMVGWFLACLVPGTGWAPPPTTCDSGT